MSTDDRRPAGRTAPSADAHDVMRDAAAPQWRDRVLSAATIKALAHPLRVRILDELAMFGPLTASGLGERLGESSGSTSYHLRQLARHDLVQEVEGHGTARERWWERTPAPIATPDPSRLAPGSAERLATQLVSDEWIRARERNHHEFLGEGETVFGPTWVDAATTDTTNLRLTSHELAALVAELEAVIDRAIAEHRAEPTPGALPVQIQLAAFPLVRGIDVGRPAATSPPETEE
ncbi:ArsR/SmtB family transcription factor [Agromyces aerolatus]|uniref:ArsR/SmtB family transcription factor n=1 Tax=Agromyces sp. LY-1074 TaxID=3074080 RepID=UPI002854E831|nr:MULTISPECIES: helix-turn-helix domain-containing protein [unclassified Agromyces]MDR5701052.1 helix-turn-helix domain-containing protein [Agromyces sp. LY-1074]MDR5707692.1 helix-turn-helix domain-containing protein [Agromyces sp. LY-1358]